MNHSEAPPVHPLSSWIAIALAVSACVPWLVASALGLHPSTGITVALTGGGILGAAFLLSWAVEVAELDLPQALAVSILALVAVLPEYAVDATFAWEAARDPSYAQFAVANMTGANRMLIGLGWSMVVFLAWARFGRPGIRLPGDYGIDVVILLAATVYAFVPVIKGSIGLIDTAVLLTMYILYIVAAARSGVEEESELVGPSALIGELGPTKRRLIVVFFLVYAAVLIFFAAEPFAHSLVAVGVQLGIEEFLLVQWLAPIASEAPELVVAALLVWQAREGAGIRTLVSSKVNQWTLLVGTLAVVYSLSAGHTGSLQLDARQQEELALTAAQSFFAIIVVADGHLSRLQAIALFSLFLLQLFIPIEAIRWIFSGLYIVAGLVVLAVKRDERQGLLRAYGQFFDALRGRKIQVEE